MNLSDAGLYIAKSRTTVRRMIDDGVLTAKIDPHNGRLVVDKSELDRYLASFPVYVPPDKAVSSQCSHTPNA